MLSNARQPCDEGFVRSQQEVVECLKSTGRWVLAASILGSSIGFIDGTVVNTALPVLQSELGASVGEAQWIVETYALMHASLILVGGSMGDRFGRKRVFVIGILLFAIASVFCGLAADVNQLIVARGVQGVGAALLVPGSLALISASFSKQQRGRAIGTWSGFTAIAAGFGPVLGGWLVDRFSWRLIFFINIPLAFAVILIALAKVPESKDDRLKGGLDWVGALLATTGLGGLVFGLIESNANGFTSPKVVFSLLVGLLLLVGFVFVEAYKQEPMVPLSLFRSRTFSGANLLTLLLYGALGGLFFFFPFNLIQIQGYSASAAGAALLPFVITMFLLSRWAGGLVETYGSRLPLVVGPTIAAAGFASFALPGAQVSSYWTSFFPAVMVMSIGMTISVAPLTTTVMGAVEERHAGVASGINNAVSRTAALLAVAVFGVFMLHTFKGHMAKSLNALPISHELKSQLLEQSTNSFDLRTPEAAGSDLQLAVRRASQESFIAGFRLLSCSGAVLALLGVLAGWLLIEPGSPVKDPNASPKSPRKIGNI